MIVCDRCGKSNSIKITIPDYKKINIMAQGERFATFYNKYEIDYKSVDLCPECLEKLIHNINNFLENKI